MKDYKNCATVVNVANAHRLAYAQIHQMRTQL